MKYDPIPADLFIGNRARLAALLPVGALAIVNAADIQPAGADAGFPFRQNSDLFYLTGTDQEETILLLFPGAKDEKRREILFVRESSEHVAIWEGHKYSKKEATAVSGIKTVLWLSEFKQVMRDLAMEASTLFLNANEHLRADVTVETRDDRFIARCRRDFPLHQFARLAPLLHALRVVKSQPEIDLLQRACDITEAGFRRVCGFVKPGVNEYQIEAEFAHEFLMAGSRGFAYPPIIASGAGSCCLHYVANDRVVEKGDILLLDVAAEYANYNADMTRTIPVDGRFTKRQRAVYDAVLRVMRGASDMLRPGTVIKEYQKEVGLMIQGELIDLGLLTRKDVAAEDEDSPAYRKYFMHGTSHHLGLDVHDVALPHAVVEGGHVYTVEPGIYVPDENLGIRLENDILVGEDSNLDLMAGIPIEAEEVEDLMNL